VPVSEPSKTETPEALDTQAFAGFGCPLKSASKLHLTTALTTDSEIFRNRKSKYPGVAQLVARVVWEQNAAGSDGLNYRAANRWYHRLFSSKLFRL